MAVGVRYAHGKRTLRAPQGRLESVIVGVSHILQRKNLPQAWVGTQRVHVRSGIVDAVFTGAGGQQIEVGWIARRDNCSVQQMKSRVRIPGGKKSSAVALQSFGGSSGDQRFIG